MENIFLESTNSIVASRKIIKISLVELRSRVFVAESIKSFRTRRICVIANRHFPSAFARHEFQNTYFKPMLIFDHIKDHSFSKNAKLS